MEKFRRIAITLAMIGAFTLLSLNVVADNGGYVVQPHRPDQNLTPEQRALIDDSGADGTVTFWQLPLWIQVSCLWEALLTLACSLLVLPLVVRRIDASFENRNRQEVFEYIKDNPGCIAPDVSRGTGINKGTTRYHIQWLETEGKIVLKKIGKFMHLFKNSSTYDDMEKLVASHLRNDTSMAIMETLLDHPGSTNQDLAGLIAVEKSLIYRYLQQLLQDGIASVEDDGRHKRYSISGAAMPAVVKLLPRHYQCPGMLRDYGKGEV